MKGENDMVALTTLFPVFFGCARYDSKIKRICDSEQKAGANSIVFNVLFPILIFNI